MKCMTFIFFILLYHADIELVSLNVRRRYFLYCRSVARFSKLLKKILGKS